MERRLSSVEKERLNYINFLMDDLYDDVSDLYESLVDREMSNVKETISTIIFKLKDLQDSIEDDI
jgi:hypothetical protein